MLGGGTGSVKRVAARMRRVVPPSLLPPARSGMVPVMTAVPEAGAGGCASAVLAQPARRRRAPVTLAAAVLAGIGVRAAPSSPMPAVYQDLEEATVRITRLDRRPYEKLWDTNGFFQSERMIFHDRETGAEVWSLTQELCTDLANIERRCAWSCNGQFISFIGNKVFWNHLEHRLWKRTWAGYNYIAKADGSARRKLWGNHAGRLVLHQDKFNTWDQRRPDVLYYPDEQALWKVTLGGGETNNTSEIVYRFPTRAPRIIQDVSDGNLLLIEEGGRSPNCYVVDANRRPGDPKFCLVRPLKGEVHPGSFRFRRSGPIITGGYEDQALRAQGEICLRVDADRGLVETALPGEAEYGIHMAHLWYGPPDDRVVFSGDALGEGFGLWVRMPGAPPRKVATVNDGHPTWCGHDSEWFFYACGTGDVPGTDARYRRRLIAGRWDNSEVRILCTPYDRRRGDHEGGYDAIPRPHQSPDATKCWFHSSMLMPTNAFTGSYIAVFRRPYAPTAVAWKDGRLSWTPHALSHEARGWLVYRREPSGRYGTGVLVAGTNCAAAENGTYMVTALEWSGLESDASSPTLSLPGLATGAPERNWDTVPPPAVAGFSATREADGQHRLRWQKSPAADLRYYNLYFSDRGPPAVGQQRLIASPQEDVVEYLDWTAPPGRGPAFYAITAVDRQGNESPPAFASIRPTERDSR